MAAACFAVILCCAYTVLHAYKLHLHCSLTISQPEHKLSTTKQSGHSSLDCIRQHRGVAVTAKHCCQSPNPPRRQPCCKQCARPLLWVGYIALACTCKHTAISASQQDAATNPVAAFCCTSAQLDHMHHKHTAVVPTNVQAHDLDC
jgi:hypothetical protein